LLTPRYADDVTFVADSFDLRPRRYRSNLFGKNSFNFGRGAYARRKLFG
jgi:hypothetical protein